MSSPHYEDSINHVNSNTTISGLPDGLFPNQKSHFGYTQEVLAVEDVGTFYDQVAYFTTIWWIFWPFGRFCGPLVYFFHFWFVVLRKILQRCYD
jgi:hypothetical protein